MSWAPFGPGSDDEPLEPLEPPDEEEPLAPIEEPEPEPVEASPPPEGVEPDEFPSPHLEPEGVEPGEFPSPAASGISVEGNSPAPTPSPEPVSFAAPAAPPPPPTAALNWPTPQPSAPPPPPVSNWPGSPPQAYGTPKRMASNATASLILGIVGVVLCPLITSIPAVVLGRSAKREIAANPHELSGESQAKWGIALGWIGIAWGLLVVILFIAGVMATGEFITE